MTFTATPATPFTAGVSTIPATTANTWRANIAASLDTVGGGAYANVSVIDWSAGSAGWRFYAPLAVKSTGTLTLDAGATVTINADPSLFGTMRVGIGGAGGAVRFYPTSTLTVDDTVACSIAGDVTMTGASTMVHASGSTDTYSSGSTFLITSGATANLNLGGTAASGVTFIGANGAAVWNGASTATWQTASVSNWNSGANFTVTSGAIANATFGGGGTAGTLAVGATGTFTITAGAAVTMSIGGGGTSGSLTINANGTLTTSASSTIAMSGTTTLSGNGAYTRLRVHQLADPPAATLDARNYDIVECNALTSPATITLDDLGANDKVKMNFYIKGIASTLTINATTDAGPGVLVLYAAASGAHSTEIYWTGTAFRILNNF